MTSPKSFFKFVSFDRKDILENGLIRFSPIREFNDPFELEPTITPLSRKFLEYIRSLSESEIRKIETNDEDLAFSTARAEQVGYYKEKYKQEINKHGVLSLCSNNKINPIPTVSTPKKDDPRTNILLWSHYADSHKGFVIELSENFIEGIEINKVDYSGDRDYLTFEDVDEGSFKNVFYKKSVEWSYEQEYRSVFPLEKAYKVNDRKIHLYKIKKSHIKSITFGCKMSKLRKKEIISLIKNDNEFCGVHFNHARLNDKGFFLDFYGDDGCRTNNPDVAGVRCIPIQKKF